LGKRTLWVVRRNETLFAISLASDALPIPALDKIILLVRSLDNKNKTGEEKMLEALIKIQPILEEFGVQINKESDVKYLIDTAVRIMRKQARVISKE
jgi:hypothetical protein